MLLSESDGKVDVLEKIITFLSKSVPTPKTYGPFHILSLLIIFGLCALVIINRHRLTEKALPYFILICGAVMLAFEIYKQLVLTYRPESDRWIYQLFAFPFQFCSTPTYIALLAFLFYKLDLKKVYNAFLAFIATYGMIAASVVLFVGTRSVLCSTLGINIQTMVHHGLMLIMSVAILAGGGIKENRASFIGASLTFLPLLTIALIFNFCIDGLDLFYLSPDSTFVYKGISDFLFGGNLPYIIYLIGYIVLFAVGAALIMLVSHKIKHSKTENKS